MIVVYAGVQADEAGRESPRLPFEAQQVLTDRLRGLFGSLKPRMIVGALASGSDILIAEAGVREGSAVHVFLPYDAELFKTSSVSPRGESWERRYDVLVEEPKISITTGTLDPNDRDAFLKHNLGLLDRAATLAEPGERIWALTVRPPQARAAPSVSDDFADRASSRGYLCLDLNPIAKRSRGFIAMSYGVKFDPHTRTSYDCDQIFHKVYRPVLEDLDVDWTRADLQTDSGIIHVGMVDDLANSGLVIADLGTWNFNVAYELGLRHVFAPASTVLVNPIPRESTSSTPPFDVNILRTVQFPRSSDLTDQEAEEAITRLRPVLVDVLRNQQQDSPVHEWFDLSQVRGPYLQRSHLPFHKAHELDVRKSVKSAIRSSDASEMLRAVTMLETESLPEEARAGLRFELGAALIDEGAYEDAAALLMQAEPETDSTLHRVWLHKTAMAFRRAGDISSDQTERAGYWNEAEKLLIQAFDLGYNDSETFGIYGGFIKKQLTLSESTPHDLAAVARFDRMTDFYQKGFEADPSYYTGVNLVMALRLSSHIPADEAGAARFVEALTVSKFLVRLALVEDSRSFWPAATNAELLLHEALHYSQDTAQAAAAYAKASLLAKPDHLRSALHQLDFLQMWGDSVEIIDLMKNALSGELQ